MSARRVRDRGRREGRPALGHIVRRFPLLVVGGSATSLASATCGAPDDSAPPTTPTTEPTPAPELVPGLAGRVWNSIPTPARVVVLTFDAGANAEGLPPILATLAATSGDVRRRSSSRVPSPRRSLPSPGRSGRPATGSATTRWTIPRSST
ncbi:MAG TPA: hypothetical protein VND62_08480 [Acidimicrobiales bacterium]|nr:hypothetical protein [Acidimicrobiales bacterium]